MDLARLRQQAQLRHDDNAGQGTFTLPTGELLALLDAIEAAEEVSNENALWGDVNLGTMCALAANLAALKESPCPACRGKGRIQSGTGPDGYRSKPCAHCQEETP